MVPCWSDALAWAMRRWLEFLEHRVIALQTTTSLQFLLHTRCMQGTGSYGPHPVSEVGVSALDYCPFAS